MFGSPIKLTLLISLIFGVGAGTCLMLLTRPVALVEQREAETLVVVEEGVNCWVTLRSAHPMKSVRVFRNNEEVAVDHFSERESEVEFIAQETLTFKIMIKWPEGTPETAVLVKVEPEGELTREKTLWAEGSLTQELDFTLDTQNEN